MFGQFRLVMKMYPAYTLTKLVKLNLMCSSLVAETIFLGDRKCIT